MRSTLKILARTIMSLGLAICLLVPSTDIVRADTIKDSSTKDSTIKDSTIAGVGEITKAGSNETVAVDGVTAAAQSEMDSQAAIAQSLQTASSVAAAGTTTGDNAAIITVDLVIFAGQSNMSGAGGDPSSAPTVAEGQGYEFKYGSLPTGMYTVTEPFGVTANGYICDPPGLRSGSLVSAFMNTYYKNTGVPVLGVSASRGGTDLNFWNNPTVTTDLISKYNYAVSWCNSNNVKIRRKYLVWLQGETDAIAGVTAEKYMERLSTAMAPIIKNGIEQIFIVTIGQCGGVPGAYDQVVAGQEMLCMKDGHYTLGTDILHTLPDNYLIDGIHYSQVALNMAGSAAATTAATFSKLLQ